MTTALPTHPVTGLTALGVVGGRPVWPAMGGDGNDPAPEKRTGQPAPQPADPDANAPDTYPPDTPVAEMTSEQQTAYWKAMARKHEARAKQAPSDDELQDLRQAKKRLEELEDENRTELEKAAQRATKATEDATNAKAEAAQYQTELERVRAAVTRGLPEGVGERLLNAARRLAGATAEELDADAADYFTTAPLQPAIEPKVPDMDQGNRGTGPAKPSVARGRELYEARRNTTNQ